MSTINKARRGFLKLLPTAPVAATVAAKQAAVAMGLSGPLNAAAGLGGMANAPMGYAGMPVPPDGMNPWFLEAIKNFTSKETIEQHRISARGMARVLDPDLAAMRSLSPAQAYQIQVERCFQRFRQQEKSYIDREMERWSKQNPGAALAQQVMS